MSYTWVLIMKLIIKKKFFFIIPNISYIKIQKKNYMYINIYIYIYLCKEKKKKKKNNLFHMFIIFPSLILYKLLYNFHYLFYLYIFPYTNKILIYIKQILFNVYIFHFRGFIFNNILINHFYNK